MNIVICFPKEQEASRWQADLQQHLPHATIALWQPSCTFQADYAIVWRATQAFFDSQTQLKAIFNAGAGVDALLALKVPAHIPIVRLEDAGMGAQMAQYVAHAALKHVRQFDVYAHSASLATWQPKAPQRMADFPIGIMGYGVLGQAIASGLIGLGFTVHAWARRAALSASIPVYAGEQGLPTFLAATRILVCVLPLTPHTQGLVNHALLKQLRPKAYFINVARGEHVNETDLLTALSDGTLAGATLDVCTHEPAGQDHPFWKQSNLTLTPHIAAASLRQESIAQIAQKLLALASGESVSGVINTACGY